MGRSGGASAAVLATAAAMFLGRASAQDSCVQVSNTSFVPSCPCDAGSALTFGIEGQTTVTANTVNLAIVMDGSGSISPDEFLLSKDFAKNTAAAFADENLFANGGTASFTQFTTSATLGGTFTSQEDFDEYVDAEVQVIGGGTNIPSGVERGSELLAAAPNTSTSFMVVITDGVGGDPTDEANAARAAGTIVYAVGVGTGPDQATLLAIAGDESNIFDVDDFTELGSALEGIISTSAGSIPCAATGATVSLDFNAATIADASVGDASGTAVISDDGTSVTFELSGTLEATPTAFSVVLEFCDEVAGDDLVATVTYADDEGNEPDLSALEGSWATVPTCDSKFTPAPVSPTGPLPTPVPTVAYSYDYSYTTDSWFDDDDDATFSYPVAPTPSPSQKQPVGPAPHVAVPPTGHPIMMPTKSDDDSDSDSGDGSSPGGDTKCDNGFYGIQSGTVCCEAGCGSCGGVGCSGRPGGAHACCVTEIRDEGEECSVAGSAPCYIDDSEDDDGNGGNPVQTPSPDTPPPPPTSSTDDDEESTSYSYDFDSSSWYDDDGAMVWCSNGIPGVESAKGDVCCALGCGQCGGVGCSRFGAPDLDAYDCCTSEILSFGESCLASGQAPCYMDDRDD